MDCAILKLMNGDEIIAEVVEVVNSDADILFNLLYSRGI